MKKLIGYGYTNSQGVATLDYDTDDDEIDGYTGTGAGLMNFRAEMHDDSSLQSETYELIDATFVDRGISSDYGTWSVWSTYPPLLSRTNEYTSIKVNTEDGRTDARIYKLMSGDSFCIEFDMLLKSNSVSDVFASIRNQWNTLGNMDLGRFNLTLNNWHHIKMVYNGSTVVVTNNTNSTSYTYQLSNTFERFLFQISSSTTEELQYKNFCIYPI